MSWSITFIARKLRFKRYNFLVWVLTMNFTNENKTLIFQRNCFSSQKKTFSEKIYRGESRQIPGSLQNSKFAEFRRELQALVTWFI